MTLREAVIKLRAYGIILTKREGEYRVNFRGGKEETAYYTDDLQDAVQTGIVMWERRYPKNPPRKKNTYGKSKFRTDLVFSGGKWYIYDFAFGEVKKGPFKTLSEAKSAFAILKSRRRYTTSPRYHSKLGFKTKYKGGQKPHSNPGTLIYSRITRIEGTKGKGSQYPGQKFFHNFKRPYPAMYGLKDGTLLIK